MAGLRPLLAVATLATCLAGSAPAFTEPPRAGAPGAKSDARTVAEALDKLGGEVRGWGGTVGFAAIDVATGTVLAARGEHLAQNPASNAKLATAAAALKLLGPGRRFTTGLYGRVERDTIPTLVLRGDGDPSLTSRDLAALAHELKGFGVRHVREILVDQSLFDDRYAPPAFEQQPTEWARFRAPVAPVSVDENTVTFTVRPTKKGSEAVISVEPLGFVDLAGAVGTTAKGDPDKLVLALEPKGQRLGARFSGTIPDANRPTRLARRVDDPRLFAGYVLRAALQEAGIDAPAEIRAGGEGEKRLLVHHTSAPLGELLFALGKDSDNFYAEMIFKALAADKARPATAEQAADLVVEQLRALGGFEAGVVVKNGSGLFDANRTTPLALANLLRAAYRSPEMGPEFVAHLSIGGVDGTLQSRFKTWAKTRAIRAKTGTLEAVAALSGYVLAPPGKSPIAFSLLVNGIPGKVTAARPSMDQVIDALARERWPASSSTE